MKQKLLAALEQRYGGALGSKNEIYEKVVTAYGNLITSEEQIPDIVAGVEPLLKQFQSVKDKLRAFENKPKPEPTPKPSDNGNQPPEPNSEPKPQGIDVDALVDRLNAAWEQKLQPLQEKLNAFETAKTAELAVKQAQEKFGADAWVNGYPKLRDDAWKQAMRMYERTGKTMTAEELQAEAMECFKPLAKLQGLDISKPFQSDGGAGDNAQARFEAMAKRQQERQGAVAE
jgi:hypothetical protein